MFLEFALLAVAPIKGYEAGWWTDFDKAKTIAARDGKALMVNFTGSDWCGFCIKLEGEVFSKSEFKDWADEKVVKVKVDFPQSKVQPQWEIAQNQKLQEKYQIQGYPTIVFMNSEGKVYGESGYLPEPGAKAWTAYADKILSQPIAEQTSAEVSGEYPAIVKDKNLYAKNDYRGKKGPKYEFGTYLSATKPDLKGKIVVVDYWATWCGPCRELIPEMNTWSKKFAKDVVFIGLSDEAPDLVKGFMANTKMDYFIATDPEAKMKGQLGVEGIPHVMVVTPDGIVRWQGWPQDEKDRLTEEKIQQIIDAWKAKSASGA